MQGKVVGLLLGRGAGIWAVGPRILFCLAHDDAGEGSSYCHARALRRQASSEVIVGTKGHGQVRGDPRQG